MVASGGQSWTCPAIQIHDRYPRQNIFAAGELFTPIGPTTAVAKDRLNLATRPFFLVGVSTHAGPSKGGNAGPSKGGNPGSYQDLLLSFVAEMTPPVICRICSPAFVN
jgi:hypothetical protein